MSVRIHNVCGEQLSDATLKKFAVVYTFAGISKYTEKKMHHVSIPTNLRLLRIYDSFIFFCKQFPILEEKYLFQYIDIIMS